MPFASKHYPFENRELFDPKKKKGFPADFIAEGQDQTRGWFNTMLILSTALFEQTSYKNVIVNGTILAEDGRKMSKSLKNYPDVNYILNTYGADAMRLYLLSSPAVRSSDLAFTEKDVDQMNKKVITKTKNVLAFYNLYKDELDMEKIKNESPNLLDRWIIERTKKLIREVTDGLETYQLDEATRPFVDFVDDLST
jgi:isoleucyl-tRNA synthetase